MKVVLIFSGAEPGAAFAPYRTPPFLDRLAGEGITPLVIECEGAVGAIAPEERVSHRRCPAHELRELLAQERPDAIQTFGWASTLAPVWSNAAQSAVPLVHFVSAGGPVDDDTGLGFACARVRPKLTSLAGWRARIASRSVVGVIGSNRTDIARHIDLGFFPRAEFSLLAPPPVEAHTTENERPAAPTPTFGVYDPEATARVLSFLARAVSLTGRPDDFAFRIAPSRLRAQMAAAAAMSFVDADLDAFTTAIDALVLPYCEDRMMPALVAALKARKIVIAPDGGLAAELIEYGRHGVVYAAGSAYQLSLAINIVAQSWKNRPIDFSGVDTVVSRASPQEVARLFAGAYRRLVA